MTFNLQPTLSSARVALRPLTGDDWQALFAAASDPLIWAIHPAHDRWQAPVFRAFFDEALASGGALVALDPASGVVIGASRYDFGRAAPGEIEIGWTFLVRNHWGKATNSAMKALMVGHALRHVERAIFLIAETNLRSRHAMERIGGVLTPRVDEAIVHGAPVRYLVYAIDRADFATGPLAAIA